MADRSSYREQVLEFQRGLIQSALNECGGNASAAARKLGINRKRISRVPADASVIHKIEGWAERGDRSFRELVHAQEKQLLQRALRECRGNGAAAAKKLGLSLSSFYRRCREHAISLWPDAPPPASSLPSRDFKAPPGWVVVLGSAASEFLIDEDPAAPPSERP